MSNLLYILAFVVGGLLIWKMRQQSEHAKGVITKHCRNLDLQLLSIARSSFNFKLGEHFLEASFVFEFSSDNENNYQGTVYLSGLKRPRFELPPYRCFDNFDN